MTGSRLAHCILTEPVCKSMSGKGREGIRKGMEGKSSSKPNPIRLVSDAPRPGRWEWEC